MRMKSCLNLIGQMCPSWTLIGCIITICCLQVEANEGAYGTACEVNSDCQLGFVCLYKKCACDNNYFYDNKGVCKKICRGSSEGLVRHGDFNHQYLQYKNRYTNCSYVDGNLEITSLEGAYDLGFLKDIEEIDGYLLVVNVYSNYLNLTNLRIIRGNELFPFRNDNYSMYIALNHNPKNISQGLMELQFKSLTEIVKGQVYFQNNNLLCFLSSISWDDINPNSYPHSKIVFDSLNYKRQCPSCPADCYNPHTKHYHCWGSSPDMCQKLNYIKKVCSETCDGRCFGPDQNQCCHPECAAGCTGPRKTECLACKNFNNDGECHAYCPQMRIYDSNQMKWVENPDGRYSSGSLCVKDCPNYLVKDNDACVIKCPEGKHADKSTNVCEKCEGPCPKNCPGVSESGFLHSKNLEEFRGCTVVEGNLKILKVSFEGDPHEGTEGIKVEDLQVLSDIKEITGFVSIQEAPPTVKDLSFLSGLETIYGRYLSTGIALNVLKMDIQYLGLTSLHHISHGGVLIALNPRLCYIDTLDMSLIFGNPTQKFLRKANKDKSECDALGLKCHSECSSYGCWGPGPDKCLQCKTVRMAENNTCLASCLEIPMLYRAENNTCKQCNEQCAGGCTGPGPDECFECKQVKVLGQKNTFECMTECPLSLGQPYLYPDENRICRQCDLSCDEGCTGPSSAVKVGGCNTCLLAINKTLENDTVRCLPRDQDYCPRGYYEKQYRSDVPHPLTKKQVCQPCDHLCLECNGPGNANCPVCRYYRYTNRFSTCIDTCPPSYTYPDNGECLPCSDQCLGGCHGSNSTECENCLNFKVFIDEELQLFSCVEKCPENLPHLVEDQDPDKPTMTVCASDEHPAVMARAAEKKDEERKKILTIALPVCGGVILLGGLLALFGYYWRQRERAKENTLKLTAKMTGVVDTEPLTPTDAKPDLSKLRLIRESELRRGGIIGSGAFGTVYKGFWIPDGENVKIPVAIKVLQEGTSPNQNQELLEEARVMASVEHPCCIRILAVCMASQMMLITQLMPLGCLLDYIRKHKDNTGSKSLLNWCTQIARGMGYLEERGIVHRDLAARNVLVQSAGQVKITDFGLAKLLDYNEDEYHASGGKMPIKWLALECIQNRIFTHKSDVWSYGVTAWELFTYGARPYENVRARDVPDLLEKGERLPQPAICTIDVYMIMIKCWMLDAESRPSFSELAEEFAKMARDPGRYLVIQGDELKKIPSEEVLDEIKVEAVADNKDEGDKLMRLPSYSYDKDDLARHLSVAAEGPEEVIEADEYLQPAPPVPLQIENNNFKVQHLGGATNKEQPQLIREKRYGHLESASAAKQQRDLLPSNRLRGDSINGRYSSDPVKYTRNRDDVDGNVMLRFPKVGNGNIPNNQARSPKPVSPPVMQLPLDEDDYLQPKSANPKAYLDLENSKDYYINEKQMSPEDAIDNYLVPNPVPTLFENPEYFEGDPRDSVFNRTAGPSRDRSVKPKVAPKPKRLTDYYNDMGMNSPTEVRQNEPLLSNCSNGESAV
ncbi:epidermal growth factor receptor-like isoform X3 [Mercenaria mercenaria]|nr:epidermal growth factor receptor-like isoform X3 [Mercenaria mercenaria]XP_045177596.2 epidermal growth factor receptor-like isoform X3 [Mercenaria mercenaria]XP_053386518.1 epidermal growth factor receptor-like isoform X3 [Mercenaria mercenaria]